MLRASRRRARIWPALLVALACVAHAGCGQRSEPPAAQSLEVMDVVTGWLDAGIADGQNKLVPTLSFRVKNKTDARLTYVTFNAVFRVINDPEELGASLLRGIDSKGLGSGEILGPLVARSNLGYTSPAPRLEMLQHSQFRDAQVELFVKHQSTSWVKIGEYKIQRQLLTR